MSLDSDTLYGDASRFGDKELILDLDETSDDDLNPFNSPVLNTNNPTTTTTEDKTSNSDDEYPIFQQTSKKRSYQADDGEENLQNPFVSSVQQKQQTETAPYYPENVVRHNNIPLGMIRNNTSNHYNNPPRNHHSNIHHNSQDPTSPKSILKNHNLFPTQNLGSSYHNHHRHQRQQQNPTDLNMHPSKPSISTIERIKLSWRTTNKARVFLIFGLTLFLIGSITLGVLVSEDRKKSAIIADDRYDIFQPPSPTDPYSPTYGDNNNDYRDYRYQPTSINPSDKTSVLLNEIHTALHNHEAFTNNNNGHSSQLIHHGSTSSMMNLDTFEDANSPQFKALSWMEYNDHHVVNRKQSHEKAHRWLIVLLYFAFDGDEWTSKTNWLTSEDECNWEGIECEDMVTSESSSHYQQRQEGTTIRRAIRINLSKNNLKGRIPAEISFFASLETLDLHENNIYGTIPSSAIGKLRKLKELDLSNNHDLDGKIPGEFGYLRELEELNLEGCSLTGNFPTSLGDMSRLRTLKLNSNQLDGDIPTQIGKLSELRVLQIGDNRIHGFIPTHIGRLRNLEHLELWSNRLYGSIPNELKHLSNMSFLYLDHNNFQGSIPSIIGELPLIDLTLGDNSLQGPLPTSIGNLSNLRRLWVSNNYLTGEIPQELFLLSNNLKALYIDGNQFTGTLSPEFSKLISIEDIRLYENSFTGCLPRAIFDLRRLRVFYADHNKFDCELPDYVLSKSRTIKDFQIQNNKFSGPLPSFRGISSPLEILNMGSNSFTGTVHDSYGGLSNLLSLDLSFNRLRGSVPDMFRFTPRMEKIFLEGNTLEGKIDEFLVLPKLKVLEIQDNRFNGGIPSGLGSLKDLEKIKLHDNFISGTVPESVCKLNLDVFTTDCLKQVKCLCCTQCL